MSKLQKFSDQALAQEAHSLVSDFISNGYELVAIYPYVAVNGEPIYWKFRLEHPTLDKIIRPFKMDQNGTYLLGEPEFFEGKKPIYHQNDLASRLDEIVFVVEGEKCAVRLSELGLLATTSGSSTSANRADWSLLAGRSIAVWRDADGPGLKYAEDVTKILLKLGCSVQWVDIEKLNLPKCGDCDDWLIDYSTASKEDVLGLTLIDPPISDIAGNSVSVNYPRFELKEDGVYYCKDVSSSIWICSWLVIMALTRDSDSSNWGRVLQFKDSDNVIRNWTMPMELLGGNGDELIKELLRLGLRISPRSSIRKLLVEYIMNSETSARARCVLRTGWYEQCFILPHKVFGNSDEAILLQSDSAINTDYHSSSELLDWQQNIALMCVGNSRLMFAVSLAFSAPLLNIINGENGGFHLRGESSSGKTTALLVAASVWGGKDYVQNWRATDNALEGLASQHNDTLLILDELSQIDPKYAGEVAYMLANGQGKARASRSGSTKQRFKWRLSFLSSGEISLASHMLEAGKRSKAGQEVRMVDIPADTGCGKGIFEMLHQYSHGAAFSEALKIACNKYHGTAGEAFLQQLVSTDTLKLHTNIQNSQAQFMQQLPADTHGQVKRVAQRFALVAAAGEIATALGITSWQEGAAIDAVKKSFDAWLNSRDSGSGSHEHETIFEQVRHFFQENAARFDIFGDPLQYVKSMMPHRCAGFRESGGDFYVYPKTFRDEICKGLGSAKDVAKIIEQCSWLIPNSKDKTSYSSVWVPTQGKTIRLYHFSSAVIGDVNKI